MKALLSFVHLLVYSNLWVSICAAVLAGFTPYLVGEEFNFPSFLLVFSATLFSYNVQRLNRLPKEGETSPSVMVNWIIEQKSLVYVFVGIGLVGCIVSLFLIHWEILLLLLPFGFISMAYTVNAAFGKSKRNGLRDIPGAKIFLIAVTWAGATLLVPLVQVKGVEFVYDIELWVLFVQRLFFVIAITIPFDVRDLKYDEPEKKTIPQLIGAKNSVAAAIVIMLLVGWLELMHSLDIRASQLLEQFLIILGMYVVSIVLIALTSPKRSDLHYTFSIEALSLLMGVSYFLTAAMI